VLLFKYFHFGQVWCNSYAPSTIKHRTWCMIAIAPSGMFNGLFQASVLIQFNNEFKSSVVNIWPGNYTIQWCPLRFICLFLACSVTDFIHVSMIQNLTNCTTIQGNLKLLEATFDLYVYSFCHFFTIYNN